MTLDEMIAAAQERHAARETAWEEGEAKKLQALIDEWKAGFRSKLAEAIGDELLTVLAPVYLPGEQSLSRIRARFGWRGVVYEVTSTDLNLYLDRRDDIVFNEALCAEEPTEYQAQTTRLAFVGPDGNRLMRKEDRADYFLVRLAALAELTKTLAE